MAKGRRARRTGSNNIYWFIFLVISILSVSLIWLGKNWCLQDKNKYSICEFYTVIDKAKKYVEKIVEPGNKKDSVEFYKDWENSENKEMVSYEKSDTKYLDKLIENSKLNN